MAKRVKFPLVVIPGEDVEKSVDTFDKGPLCTGCPLSNKHRLHGRGPLKADIMFVSEAPSTFSAGEKQHFLGKGGRVIREARKVLIKNNPEIAHLATYDTYAVQCEAEPDDINKKVLDRCSRYLHMAIRMRRPKVVLTFGANALKATGIHPGGKFDEIRGKQLTLTVGGDVITVIPTFSTRALLKSSGLYNLLYTDMYHAMRIASGKDESQAETNIEELSKNYVIPKTLEEVRALCKMIQEFSLEGATPATSGISVDTETNTLDPQRADAKMLCVSFAWADGRSCAIPLWHKDAPWTPEELPEVVKCVGDVLQSAKPKFFHNFKFDGKFLERRHGFKVNNVVWDSLLGEHLLREDQQGSYSLKILGRTYFPQFANYADKVHDIASALSAEEQQVVDLLAGWKRPAKKKSSKLKGADPDVFHTVFTKTELSRYYLGDAKQKKKRRQDSVNYEKVPLQDLLIYAAIDTDLTRRLSRNQWFRMRQEGFVQEGKGLMRSHCIPASRTLGGMEYRGTRVDRSYLEYLKAELPKAVATAEKELRQHWRTGEGEFNPNSTVQLGLLLFNYGVYAGNRWNPHWGDYSMEAAQKLGARLYTEAPFDVVKNSRANDPLNWRTRHIDGVTELNEKSQQWKTDKKTLRAIVEYTMKKGNPCLFTVALLDYRSAHKAQTGFLAEIDRLSALDGYLHTNFGIHGTATGRLSSSAMNLQNWPTWIASFNLKKLLIPDDPESEVIVNADAKGAEVKIFAAYSKDARLIEALNAGLDTHCFFLEQVYGIPYAEAMAANEGVHPDPVRGKELKALRTIIKRVVFGILYGAGPKKIAETAGVPLAKAQEVIERLLGMFPSIPKYVEETKAQIRRESRVQTYFGRRRRFPLHQVSSFFRSQSDRRGVNMLIQSTSSDIVLGQLCEIDDHLHEIGGRLALTVHDSIVAVVGKKYIRQVPDFFKYYCEDRVAQKYPWLPVRFAWDVEVGPSYGELVPVKHYLEAGALASELAAMETGPREARLESLKEGTDPFILQYVLNEMGGPAALEAMTEKVRAGRLAATGKALHKATMFRVGDAEREFQALHAVDLSQRLEEQFDEEAMDELRDFENANKEEAPKVVLAL